MCETEESQKSLTSKLMIGSRLSTELYYSFVNYLNNGRKAIPSKSLLDKEMSQTMQLKAKKTDFAIRKKFTVWAKRMTLSNGVLLHKPTNKTIIPEMEFYETIKSIHESSPRHLNVTQTVKQIKSRFTWTSKYFGMDLKDVLTVLSHCQHKMCQKSVQIIKSRLKSKPELISEIRDNCHSSIKSDGNETSKYFSVENQNQNFNLNSLDSSEDTIRLFEDLFEKINLLRLHINLLKVHRIGRNLSFNESKEIHFYDSLTLSFMNPFPIETHFYELLVYRPLS